METLHNGIVFSETEIKGAKSLSKVEVELDDRWFGGSQLKNLDDVKSALAVKVRQLGGNGLMNFQYGQRSVGFLRSLFSIDDVAWWGKGVAVKRNRDRQ